MTPSRIGWLAVAVAGGALTFVSVTLLNHVDTSTDRTGQLQQHLEATPPATAGQLAELGAQVDRIPTAASVPTIVVTAPPGPPGRVGPAGAPGRDGQLRATVITVAPTPAATVTHTVRPQPAAPPDRSTPTPAPSSSPVPCSVAAFLAGVCVQPP